MTQLVGHVDLTPSDIGLALILSATLQRKRRRSDIDWLCTFVVPAGQHVQQLAKQSLHPRICLVADADHRLIQLSWQRNSMLPAWQYSIASGHNICMYA